MATKSKQERLRRDQERRAQAREEARKLRRVERLRKVEGRPLEEALSEAGLGYAHSTYYERRARLEREGELGLVDQRAQGPPPKVTPEIRGYVAGLARALPRLPAAEFIKPVQEQFGVVLAQRTIQEVLQQAGLARLRGTPGHGVRRERIDGLGLQILKVVDERAGYTEALARTIKERAVSLPAPETPIPVDRSGRNDDGTFTSAYNAPRPRRDPQVGRVFDSVDLKRTEKDLTRLTIRRARLETIQMKTLSLMALPLVSDGARFTGATDPRGAMLAGFGGIAYMPETLRKFAGELKYAQVSTELMDTHAGFWLSHMRERLGVEPTGLVVYVDGAVKPLWTNMFHKCGKVSSVGRVMPCLESVLLCAGPGVPLYVQTFAGHAPLVRHLVPTIEQVEQAIGHGMFSRLTVVDSGANAFELLRELDRSEPRRSFITAMTSEQLKGLTRIEGLEHFYEYRAGDWIGEGRIKLFNSKNRKDEPLELRAIVVEQRGKGSHVGFASNAPAEEYTMTELADAYYSRWPNQEGVIRDLNGGAAFGSIHGYGKRRVLNVSVVTELEKLAAQITRLEAKRLQAADAKRAAEKTTHQAGVGHRRFERRHHTATLKIDSLQRDQKTHTNAYRNARQKQRELGLELRESDLSLREAQHAQAAATTKADSIEKKIESKQTEKKTLESRQEIYQTDVELDQTFSVLRLGWLCLIWTALHEFFDDLRLELKTFMNEILALDGYRVTTPTSETIELVANSRNRKLMRSLEQACERINAVKHKRGRRVVRFNLLRTEDQDLPP